MNQPTSKRIYQTIKSAVHEKLQFFRNNAVSYNQEQKVYRTVDRAVYRDMGRSLELAEHSAMWNHGREANPHPELDNYLEIQETDS